MILNIVNELPVSSLTIIEGLFDFLAFSGITHVDIDTAFSLSLHEHLIPPPVQRRLCLIMFKGMLLSSIEIMLVDSCAR